MEQFYSWTGFQMAKTRLRPFKNRTQFVSKKWPFENRTIRFLNGHCIGKTIFIKYKIQLDVRSYGLFWNVKKFSIWVPTACARNRQPKMALKLTKILLAVRTKFQKCMNIFIF